jgi:DNA-directed RNA polymerase specialized sigma24 family protein
MEERKPITEAQLKHYRVLQKELERLNKCLKKLYEDAIGQSSKPSDSITAQYGDEPRPGNKQPVLSFFDTISRVEGRAQDINEQLDRVEAQLKKYDGILLSLTEEERDYVYYRYFEGLEHQQVAIVMNYSESGVDRIRARALRKLGGKNNTCM